MASPREDLSPIAKGLVGSEDDRQVFFIALANNLEEETGLEAREMQIEFKTAALALAQLSFQQIAQEMAVGPVLGGGLLARAIQESASGFQSQLTESLGGLLFIKDAHRLTC